MANRGAFIVTQQVRRRHSQGTAGRSGVTKITVRPPLRNASSVPAAPAERSFAV
ncbi:hypothetical protein SAMN04488580_10781 [Mycobacterium sp. 283mftsu]|nr:hypothetical protein MMUC44124_19155 [Mycolicibacterium mucogenicum DSM 44124]SEB10109.1 hypothetical protein SAMN04488580_10781 [Mycobacterium sp. 283mftsu]